METPNCNFCNSKFEQHKTIFINVKNTEHNLVECENCHLRFYSPRISFADYLQRGFGKNEAAKEESERMLANGSFSIVKDPILQKQRLKSYYNYHIISELFRIVPDIKNCYEIGGSVGWLSYFLKQQKQNIIIDGCEVNHYSVQIANNIHGLNFTAGEFNTATIKEDSYEVIFALDFIEHTFTPYDDLKKCYKMLKKGGIIFIKTFLEELDNNRTMVCPIGHSHHFFGYVLKAILKECNFKIIKWEIEGIQVTIIGEKL